MGNKKKKTHSKQRKTTTEMTKMNPHVPRQRTGCAVYYNGGDPASCPPSTMESMKRAAEFAVLVYNETHLEKYRFVDLLYASAGAWRCVTLTLKFTAKPLPDDDDDDDGPVIFQAAVNPINKFVEYIRVVPPANLPDHFHKFLGEKGIKMASNDSGDGMKKDSDANKSVDMSVLYDRDNITCCDDKTMDIVNYCTDFAFEVYNKTHHMKFSLMELLRATGNSSMMDLMFTAKPRPFAVVCDMSPKTLRARVSFTHKYVDSFEFDPPADLP